MRAALVGVLLLIAATTGCEKATPVAAPVAPPNVMPSAAESEVPSTPMLDVPLTLAVQQRTTTAVPGSDDQLSLTIDDITRGQVMVSLLDKHGSALAGPVSLTVGGVVPFQIGERDYVIRLSELTNVIVGNDVATFVIERPEPDTTESSDVELSEEEKIDRLILAVEALDDAEFIRNGTSYSAADAAEHLRRKRASTSGQFRTAEDFIEQIASKSSLTGEEYRIRLSDGREITAGEFLRQELTDLTRAETPD